MGSSSINHDSSLLLARPTVYSRLQPIATAVQLYVTRLRHRNVITQYIVFTVYSRATVQLYSCTTVRARTKGNCISYELVPCTAHACAHVIWLVSFFTSFLTKCLLFTSFLTRRCLSCHQQISSPRSSSSRKT
jgi:hypothetical protein